MCYDFLSMHKGGVTLQGDTKIIEALNEVLAGELTAINQYFLHARMLKNWGYEKLADKAWQESVEEMKHAEKLTDRILFLEGLPNLQRLNKLSIGESVKEQLDCDLKLELENIPRVKGAIQMCFESADHATRELLEHILVDEEEHVDWLEAQLGKIKEMGLENYLTTVV